MRSGTAGLGAKQLGRRRGISEEIITKKYREDLYLVGEIGIAFYVPKNRCDLRKWEKTFFFLRLHFTTRKTVVKMGVDKFSVPKSLSVLLIMGRNNTFCPRALGTLAIRYI